MKYVLISCLFILCCHGAIVEKVTVASVATSSNQVVLSTTNVSTFSISSLQEKVDIQVKVCPSQSSSSFLFLFYYIGYL